MQWRRDPESSRKHILSSELGTAGWLSFAHAGGSLARGQTAHGGWTLKREGFLHPRVTVRRDGSDITIGILALSMSGGGILTLAGAGEYRLLVSGWSRKRWNFVKGVETVVGFERSRSDTKVTIQDGGATPETLSILCLLGRYMPLLADEDDATMVACTAAIMGCL